MEWRWVKSKLRPSADSLANPKQLVNFASAMAIEHCDALRAELLAVASDQARAGRMNGVGECVIGPGRNPKGEPYCPRRPRIVSGPTISLPRGPRLRIGSHLRIRRGLDAPACACWYHRVRRNGCRRLCVTTPIAPPLRGGDWVQTYPRRCHQPCMDGPGYAALVPSPSLIIVAAFAKEHGLGNSAGGDRDD